jgi:hypothetical protein
VKTGNQAGYVSKLQNFFSFFINRYAQAFITLVILAGVFFFYFNVVSPGMSEPERKKFSADLHRMQEIIPKNQQLMQKRTARIFLKRGIVPVR